MAWWRPEEEESPQSRVGRARVGATSRPIEEGEETPRAADEAQHTAEPVQPFTTQSTYTPPTYGIDPAHPPLPRRRIPVSIPIGFVALLFVAVMVLPFILVFNAIDGGDNPSGVDSPSSHDGPSLIPRERFAQAMAKVRDEAGSEASVSILRVAPDRIDAIVTKADGSRASIQVLPDLDVRNFSIGSGGQRGVSFGRIDPALPQRLVRRAAERLGRAPDQLSYLAFTSIPSVGGGGTWAIFFEGGGPGRFMTADLDGSNLRQPGG